MSDDGSPYDDWEDEVNDALDIGELGEKPDIWDVYDRDSVDDPDNWERAWDYVPDDLSDNQYDAILEAIADSDWEWEDIFDAMYEDFWDWFRESYEGT